MIIVIRNLTATPVSLPGPMPVLDTDRNQQIEITPENYDRYKNELNKLKDAGFIDLVSSEVVGSKFSFDDDNGVLLYNGAQIAPGGDVIGPSTATNNAVPVFNGTTGKLIKATTAYIDSAGNLNNLEGKINDIRHYNKSATNPTSPAPADGDRYYNTTLHTEYRYDGLRSKWLSIETSVINFGGIGLVPAGSYFNGIGGPMGSTAGHPAFHNGTLVEFAATRSNSDAISFEVTADGVAIAEITSNAILTRVQLNASFNIGSVLAVRNKLGGSSPSDVNGWIKIKWRA